MPAVTVRNEDPLFTATEHGSFVTQKACIRWDMPWHLLHTGATM
jgi:hypothetical protein